MFTKKESFSHKILDVDKKGQVVFYLNSFDVKDSDGDISDKTAFNRTIKNDFHRQKHLVNHDMEKNVGLPVEYTTDNFGLKVVSQLNMNKQISKDIYSDYELHASLDRSMEHSFGYNVMKRDEKEKARVMEYKLWEYTTMTTWGANEFTPQVDLKQMDKHDVIDAIYYVAQALRNGDFTDTKFKKLEKNMADLLEAYKLVKDSKTPQITTDNSIVSQLKYLKETLNLI